MKPNRRILVLDVGGTHIKLLVTGGKPMGMPMGMPMGVRIMKQPIHIPSGPTMTPEAMVRQVKAAVKNIPYDVVSIGYPGPVVHGRPLREPYNLGKGWVGFNFRKALGRPVKIINDAAMQALGSYKKGRMLFLGLGTGLGSAMIVDGIVEPMELAHLPYKRGKTYEDYLGIRGLKRLGRKKWAREVAKVVSLLSAALEPQDIVLGGGNAKKLKKLPPGARLGNNDNAFRGGFQLWSNDKDNDTDHRRFSS
jgi:predicted NBD/HSP70 family sugar kinase